MTRNVNSEIREWLEAEAAGRAEEADLAVPGCRPAPGASWSSRGIRRRCHRQARRRPCRPGRLFEALGPGGGGRQRGAGWRCSGAGALARLVRWPAGLTSSWWPGASAGWRSAGRHGWPAGSRCGAGWLKPQPSSAGSCGTRLDRAAGIESRRRRVRAWRAAQADGASGELTCAHLSSPSRSWRRPLSGQARQPRSRSPKTPRGGGGCKA